MTRQLSQLKNLYSRNHYVDKDLEKLHIYFAFRTNSLRLAKYSRSRQYNFKPGKNVTVIIEIMVSTSTHLQSNDHI